MKQVQALYDSAGADQKKLWFADDVVRKSTVLTDQQKMRMLEYRRQTSRPNDEFFESKILDGAIEGKDARTLAKEIDVGFKNGRVTLEKANDLKEKVRTIQARVTSNPMISKQISAYQSRMKSLVAPPGYEKMLGYTAENNPRYTAINFVFTSRLADMAAEKNLTPADVGAAYSYAMNHQGLGHMTKIQPGFGETPMSQTDSLEDLQTKRNNLIDNHMRKKRSKGMTKEESKKNLDELKRLDMNIQERKIRDEVKSRTSSQAVKDLVD